MDSLPIEIIEIIFLLVNPKDYTNFISSYDVALCFWRNKKIREKYKEQYLRVVRENSIDGSGMYVIKTIRVDNGQKHGKYTGYYENSQIYMSAIYQNGQRHGEYIYYYENGQIRTSAVCKYGLAHGKYIEYYENGQIRINATYQNGKIHGKYLNYYKNGQIQTDATYQNGQKCGKYIYYHKNGQIWIDAIA
jgi:antitoxin component YwqK of YwqJK toxin-antitoxin module